MKFNRCLPGLLSVWIAVSGKGGGYPTLSLTPFVIGVW